MSFQTVMIYVDDGFESPNRVVLGCAFAERIGARVLGVAAAAPGSSQVVDPMAMGAMVGEFAMLERDLIEAKLKSAEAQFRDASEGRAIHAEWLAAIDLPEDLIIEASRRADLILLGAGDPGNVGPFSGAGRVVLAAGRPVLVVPPNLDAISAQNIVVSWKDSREARRAIADALPFLAAAKSVTVLSVCDNVDDEQVRVSAADVVSYLATHSVLATSVIRPQADSTPAREILRFVDEAAADLVVLGGYGHTRLGEWVFGGVTDAMLKQRRVACLFSH